METNGTLMKWDPLKTMETYIDGKMRRYTLLFAVNGGAFAIGQLFTDSEKAPNLGALSIEALAIGAVLFTWLMWIDIWAWGTMMRHYFNELYPETERTRLGLEVFSNPGRAILTLLVLLITGGWLLAAASWVAAAISALSVLALIILMRTATHTRRKTQ